MIRFLTAALITLTVFTATAQDIPVTTVGWEMESLPANYRGLPGWVKDPSAKATVSKFKSGLSFSVPEQGKEYRWQVNADGVDLRKYNFLRIWYRATGIDNHRSGGYIIFMSTRGKQKFYLLLASELEVDNSQEGEVHKVIIALDKKISLADKAIIQNLVIGMKAASNNAKLYIEKLDFFSDKEIDSSISYIPVPPARAILPAKEKYKDMTSFIPDKSLPVSKVSGWDNDFVRGADLLTPKQNNLMFNGSFENSKNGKLDGWSYKLCDGAEGTVELDSSFAKSGKHSLKIAKTNGKGYIVVFCEKAIPVKAGEKLAFQGFYHTRNADYHTTLGMVRLSEKPDDLNYDRSLDRWEGFNTQQRLVNCIDGQWQKRIVSRKISEKTGALTVQMVIFGDPVTVWWDDLGVEPFENADKRWNSRYPLSTDFSKPPAISDSELQKKLEKDTVHTAEMRRIKNIAAICLDGNPVTPIIFKEGGVSPFNIAGGFVTPYGVKMQEFAVYMGDKRIEDNPVRPGSRNLSILKGAYRGKGEYDFSDAIRIIKENMKSCPDSYFIIDFNLSFYKNYIIDNPGEAWLNSQGQKGWGNDYIVQGFGDSLPNPAKSWWPSYYSAKFQADMETGIRQLVTLMKKENLDKRVIGFQVSGGHDNQFAQAYGDFSSHALKAFREFLRKKYKTDANLQKVWHDSKVTLNNASYPEQTESKSQERFLDPRTQTQSVDYSYFRQTAPFELQEKYARIIKNSFGKKMLGMKYLMGNHGGSYNGGNWTMDQLLTSDIFDITTPQPAYTERDPGKSYRFSMEWKSYALNNKMVVGEFDIRTYLRNRSSELYNCKLGRMESLKMWESGARKLIGVMIAENEGLYFFDIHWGFFQKDVATDIGAIVKTYNNQMSSYLNRKNNFHNDVLVVLDEGSLYWTALNQRKYMFELVVNYGQISRLANSGVTFDYIIFEDLIRHPELIDQYKVFVFTTSFKTDKSRMAVYDHLKKDKRTLIWLYAAGYVSESDKSVHNMKKLTGFDIRKAAPMADLSVEPVSGSLPLLKNLNPRQDLWSIERASMLLSGTYGYYDQPYFYIDDHKAEILGVYHKTGQGAIGVKKFSDWTSVYIASAGGLSAGLLNNICRQAGAYV
ncbi:MAG: hypothetical protein WC071_06360, partial [Victivallaceae bacterium]